MTAIWVRCAGGAGSAARSCPAPAAGGPAPAAGGPAGRAVSRSCRWTAGPSVSASQRPISWPCGWPAAASRAASSTDHGSGRKHRAYSGVSSPAAPQGLLVRHGHDPRHRLRPQVVRAVPAVVQHPDQGNLRGQVIKGDGAAGDLGDLAGGAGAERGQRGQRPPLRVADPGQHLLAGVLPRRSGTGREGQPDHGGPAMKRFRDPRVLSEPAG